MSPFQIELLLCIDSAPRLHALQIFGGRPIHICLCTCPTLLSGDEWHPTRKSEFLLEYHQKFLPGTWHSHPVQVPEQANYVSQAERNPQIEGESRGNPTCRSSTIALMVPTHGWKFVSAQTNTHVVEVQRDDGAIDYRQQRRNLFSNCRCQQIR